MSTQTEKLIIIGSGPAGLTAAIYAARGNLSPVVISGREPGGQLTITTTVEDYPGFPDGILGPELMVKFRQQAERLGAKFIDEEVIEVNLRKHPFEVNTPAELLSSQSVIIATGSTAKWLGLPSEKRLIGRGVSACAVCDGPFFKGKDVAVIGGGDTALREAQFLAKVCQSVVIIHRRDELRAQPALQDWIKLQPNIKFIYNSVVEDILGEEKVTGIKVKNILTNQLTEEKVDGVFVAIGFDPSTAFLKGQLNLDQKGYIIVKDETKTSVEGVFVAGDVSDFRYRQAVTAAGAGCKAALDVEEYLNNLSSR